MTFIVKRVCEREREAGRYFVGVDINGPVVRH
jgi:hypothetical protein